MCGHWTEQPNFYLAYLINFCGSWLTDWILQRDIHEVRLEVISFEERKRTEEELGGIRSVCWGGLSVYHHLSSSLIYLKKGEKNYFSRGRKRKCCFLFLGEPRTAWCRVWQLFSCRSAILYRHVINTFMLSFAVSWLLFHVSELHT